MDLARSTVAFALVALQGLGAQSAPRIVRGRVVAVDGGPLVGANVFLLESLDTAATNDAGRFVLQASVPATSIITLVARHIGFAPGSAVIAPDDTGDVTLTLERQAAALSAIRVQAGAYTAGNERGATLTALQVVTTPGATADIARAIQTLPGVQNVDEGTGLFVRGGDVSETKVLLNDAVMLSPYNYETPTGNYTVTVNPFLLDGIFFSSGGFGARYGNVLSGVADLRTAGRPATSEITATAGLANVSAGTDLALDHGLAVHATATRSDTRLLFRLNGSTRDYAPAPNGEDYSGSVIWNYRPTAEIKTFAIDRRSAFGVAVDGPSFDGGYTTAGRSDMIQAGWRDVFGDFAPSVSASFSAVHRDEGFGVFTLGDQERWWQLFGQTTWAPSPRATVRVGGDADQRRAGFVGTLAKSSDDQSIGAPDVVWDTTVAGSRVGAFGEADIRALEDLRLIVGARTDYSTFAHVRTYDPRLSAAYLLGPWTLTAAVGAYHQVSDPIYYASRIDGSGLGPEDARQQVVGAQLGDGARMARLELYDKEYRDLVGLTRDKDAVGGGAGAARGADVFLKRDLWPFFSARAAYSFVRSRRTDPTTGMMASAPFDITHSLTLIGDQTLPAGWSVSGAVRYATGKPFTPVTGAVFDAVRNVWTPSYGAPYSERLPASERVDLSLSRVTRRSLQTQIVYFVEVENLLDRDNLYEYTYSADYSQRVGVRSLFKRSIYVGGSITHTQD